MNGFDPQASRSTATAWQQRLCCLTLCTNDRERERLTSQTWLKTLICFVHAATAAAWVITTPTSTRRHLCLATFNESRTRHNDWLHSNVNYHSRKEFPGTAKLIKNWCLLFAFVRGRKQADEDDPPTDTSEKDGWGGGCRHSTVDLSVPSILLPPVRVSSTPSMLLSIYIWIMSCGKNKNKQKEVGIGPFKNVGHSRLLFLYFHAFNINYSQICARLSCLCIVKRTKINKKEAGFGLFFLKKYTIWMQWQPF